MPCLLKKPAILLLFSICCATLAPAAPDIKADKHNTNREGYYPGGQLCYRMFFYRGLLDSSIAFYYPDGKVRLSGYYKNGQKNGPWAFYYADGKPQARGRCENGMFTGNWEYYEKDTKKSYKVCYEYGKPSTSIPFDLQVLIRMPFIAEATLMNKKPGKKTLFAKWRILSKDESLEEYEINASGIKDGAYRNYEIISGSRYSQNLFYNEGTFSENKKNGRWKSDDIHFQSYQDKLEIWGTERIITFRLDTMDGPYTVKEFNNNNNDTIIKEIANYKNSNLDGEYSGGDISSGDYRKIHYLDGVENGKWEEYENNILVERMTFINGKKEGPAISFDKKTGKPDLYSMYSNDTLACETDVPNDSEVYGSHYYYKWGNIDSAFMPKREEQKIHYPDKNELYNVYSFPNAAHLVVKTFTKKTNSTRQQAFTKNGKLISDFTFANDTGITTRWKVYYENGKVAIEGNMRTYKNPEEILFFESDDKLMNIKEGDWILRNEKGKVIQIQNYYLNWLEKVTIK